MACMQWMYRWQKTTSATLLSVGAIFYCFILLHQPSFAQNSHRLLSRIEQHRATGQRDAEYVHLLFTAIEDLDLAAQAPTFLDEARTLLPRLRTPLLYADFLYAAGTVARIENRFNAASDTMRLALDHYSALGEKSKAALVYSRLGLLYQQQGIYETAIDYHLTALARAEEISSADLIFRQNVNLAALYNHLNKPRKALSLLSNAERIMPENIATQRRISLFMYKADSYTRLGMLDSATMWLNDAFDIKQRMSLKDTLILVYLYSSYAVTAQKSGQSLLAQSLLDTALAMEYAQKPMRYSMSRTLLDAARVMLFRAEQVSSVSEKLKLYRHAIDYANRALEIPLSVRLYNLWLREILAKSYAALGENKIAYKIQQEYISLSDSLFNIGLEKHIESVQERITRTKREQEIELLKNENRTRTHLQYTVALGAIILLALIFVIWNRYSLKKRSEHLVEHINQELQETNRQLIQANFLLHGANEELSLARESAEEVGRMKRAFLDTISHEIRTPLTAIQGYSQLLEMMLTNMEHKEFVERIHAAGNHLLLLFEDMLHLSKMRGDQVQIDLQPTSLHDLCRQVIAMFEEPARLKGVALSASVSTMLVSHLRLDTSKVRLILFNLVGNAIKFTESGFVRLLVEPGAQDGESGTQAEQEQNSIPVVMQSIRIVVQDSGIGIEKEALYSIFDSFRQTNIEIHRKYGGLGLGLTICKNFIDILGGTIRVESIEGEGSTFVVELPVAEGP